MRLTTVFVALHCAAFCVTAATLVFAPSTVQAQSGTLSITIEPFGTAGHAEAPVVLDATFPLGPSECTAMMPIVVGNASSGLEVDVWSSDAADANCWRTDARTPMSGATSVCTHRTTLPSMTVGGSAPPPQNVLVSAFLEDLCGTTTATTRYYWFFTTSTAGSASAMAMEYRAMPLVVRFDSQRPAAPTVPATAEGEDSVEISWTLPAAETAIYQARIFVDPTGCSAVSPRDGGIVDASTVDAGVDASVDGGVDAAMSMDALDAGTDAGGGMSMGGGMGGGGELAPGGEPPAETPFETDSAETRFVIDGSLLGWDSDPSYSTRATVYVTIVDLARNESVLSNGICVSHVDLTSSLEVICERFDGSIDQCRQHYRGCTVTGAGAPSRGATLALGAATAALLLAARRRRR